MLKWLEKFKKILPDRSDDQNTRFFKIMIYAITGILLFMIISSSLAFMIVLKGAEEVMVPDVSGMKLEEALIALQDRGLNSRIQLKYSSDPADKGNVIEQEPNPGTIRKAGSQIVMRVSKGSIIEKVENYTGWHINDLDTHLKTLFNTYGPLLKIKEPVMRINDSKPEGTILEQQPLPGTELSGLTELSLVVSRGPEGQTYEVPTFTTLDFKSAMIKAAGFNIPFLFTQRDSSKNEEKGTVILQKPQSGEQVPLGTIMQFVIVPPAKSEGKIFGILEKTLPEYPVSVVLKLEKITPQGERSQIFSMKHKGGVIAIPYFEEEGTALVVSAVDKELIYFTIKK
ncbi:MAG: PASTA domain-containing protein [Spirochaetia bacterium]|jgi:beta-lactam-binding protein with PASTA domain|nr:PASTA domain-containing protein [Spirochaetia bacterium]